jgi:Holliday junction resolvase-like predicted endonuclease
MPSGREVDTDHVESIEFRKVSVMDQATDLFITTSKRKVILRFQILEDAEQAALDIIQLLDDAT